MGTFQQIKTDVTHVGNIGRYGGLAAYAWKIFDDPFYSNEGFKGTTAMYASTLPSLPVEVHAMAEFLRTRVRVSGLPNLTRWDSYQSQAEKLSSFVAASAGAMHNRTFVAWNQTSSLTKHGIL
jgi:hypothetical protein